jgi:peroxin-5
MSLRALVTGSDMCTGSDGAGPSNAVGALVNQLLGGASKTQEQLRDVSGGGPPHVGARCSDAQVLTAPTPFLHAHICVLPFCTQLPAQHHVPPPHAALPPTAEAAAAAAAAGLAGPGMMAPPPPGSVSAVAGTALSTCARRRALCLQHQAGVADHQ